MNLINKIKILIVHELIYFILDESIMDGHFTVYTVV
jgi:hypothetical protein